MVNVEVSKVIEQPYLLEVAKPVHIVHYKEVPVEVGVNWNVPVRTVVENLQEVTKEVHHVK